jgi:serine-type D-Ala-D-Ala carboxypeptidase (penicillin-binding protein 5/6)
VRQPAHQGRLLALAAAFLLLTAAPAAAKPPHGPPHLDARAWVLIDAASGRKLAGHAATRRLPIASTTKLMTAYLALRRLHLRDRIPAAPYHALPAESVLGLGRGERLTVRDLLYALVLRSANDAAVTIAKGVSGSQRAFVTEMNRAARALGLRDTHYTTPVGLDARGNHSSAGDLAQLARVLLRDRLFARIADSRKAVLRSGRHRRRILTRNTLLLARPWVNGVKTGHTLDAGYVLVGSGRRKGVELIAAVLGTPSEAMRDADTLQLLDYGFSLYPERPPPPPLVDSGAGAAKHRRRLPSPLLLSILGLSAILLGMRERRRMVSRRSSRRERSR